MRDYALVRQSPALIDLIALRFFPFNDVGHYSLTVIEPEYIDGYAINYQGNVTADTAGAYAIQDISEFDYVFLPLTCYGTTSRHTGFRADPATGAINTKAHISGKSNVSGEYMSAYSLFKVDASQPYAVVNALAEYHPIIIGVHLNA